jgi:hypothetical protein
MRDLKAESAEARIVGPRDSKWSWRATSKGQEMPTPQGFPAPRILPATRFVMARLAESA